MTIRNFDDISGIRYELRALSRGYKADQIALSAIRRMLSSRNRITAAKDSKNDPTLQTRGPSGPAKKTTEKKVAFSVVQKLTELVADRQDKLKLALHINELIRQNFEREEGEVGAVVKKLMGLSQDLIGKTRKLYEDAESTLSEQGNTNVPDDLKENISEILSFIKGEFETPNSAIKTRYYSVADTVGDEKLQRFIHMGYITIAPFEANETLSKLVIVVSRRQDSTGKQSDYIRTFTNDVTPAAILKTNLGTKFDDSERAFKILMTSLKVDNIINQVDPTQIPVKRSQLNYTNPNILKNDVDEDNGVITFYLKNTVTSEDAANKIMQDIFVETRKLIRVIHPRAKNSVKATRPVSKKVRLKTETGSKTAERWSFKIMFSKPESGQTIELPRNKVKHLGDRES
jgi:hypothetical protein